jgi:hypothetical protein
MSADIKPSTWLGAGYTLSVSKVGLNTSNHGTPTLPQLTDAKADPTTGDIRDVLFAIVDAMYVKWLALGAAGQTTQMRLSKSVGADSSGSLSYEYRQSFTLTPGGIYTITPEP